jgi:hypothetical protein
MDDGVDAVLAALDQDLEAVADRIADGAIAASDPNRRHPQATLLSRTGLSMNFAVKPASTLDSCVWLLQRFTFRRPWLAGRLLARADLAAVLATIVDADKAGETVVVSAAGLLSSLLSIGGARRRAARGGQRGSRRREQAAGRAKGRCPCSLADSSRSEGASV